MTRRWPRLAPVVLLLMLTGCSLSPTDTPVMQRQVPDNWPQQELLLRAFEQWELQGKLAIRQEGRSESAVINFWRQQGEHFELQLSSTFLGLGATEFSGTPTSLVLTSNKGERFVSSNPMALLESETGWRLPLEHLPYWIKGIPAPEHVDALVFGSNGQPSHFLQGGWHVQIDRYHDAIPPRPALPARVTLERGEDRIRVVINEWKPEH